ncbi:MAG: hypothetical protein IEMM0003_0986 [bacterium]|nr:MAG: hypothetical protein IEMM0003_0986 [bacterium]
MEKKKIVTQTEKFIELAEKETNSDIKCPSDIMRKHIDKIASTSQEDIEKALVDIAVKLPTEKILLSACGYPDWRCSSCSFGIYLPKSSKKINDRPICLVWISFFKKNLMAHSRH